MPLSKFDINLFDFSIKEVFSKKFFNSCLVRGSVLQKAELGFSSFQSTKLGYNINFQVNNKFIQISGPMMQAALTRLLGHKLFNISLD